MMGTKSFGGGQGGGYIFGGNTGKSYEDVQRMRQQASQLSPLQNGMPRNVGEGIASIGQALMVRHLEGKAKKAEEAGRKEATNAFQHILSQPRGQWDMAQVGALSDNGYLSDAQRGVMATLVQQDLERRLGVSGGPAQMSPLDQARLEGERLENERRRQELEAGPERRMFVGADGRNYFSDTLELVLPDVVIPPDLTSSQKDFLFSQENPGFAEYQENIRRAGASKTHIDMGGSPEPGKLSTDYGYVRNPDGTLKIGEDGLLIAAAVPGSPAWQDQQSSQAAEERNTQLAQTQAGDTLEAINIAKGLAQNSTLPTTGFFGAAMQGVPGTAAHDLASAISTIEANVGFDKLQYMRDASPTGGALGQVSNIELNLLKSSIASLRQSQSQEQFLQNLSQVEQRYNAIIHGPDATQTQGGAADPSQLEGDDLVNFWLNQGAQ